MENKNGQGIFYGVIGVATLIVAIIGATFAYFSATGNTNASTISGTTGSGGGLSLVVTDETTSATGRLVPQLTSALGTAVAASCVDGNSNTVCKVYSIVVSNVGTSAVATTGTLDLEAGTANTHMHWALLDGSATAVPTGGVTAKAAGSAVSIDNPTLDAAGGANASKTYYVVVWLEETNNAQDSTDANQAFTGTVTFEGAGSGHVTSTFTA